MLLVHITKDRLHGNTRCWWVCNGKTWASKIAAASNLTINSPIMKVWVSMTRDDLQNLTLVTTVFPFSDKCLSTYPEDSRSLETERKEKRELKLENLWFSFKCHSVIQVCLYFMGGLYSVLAAQSFRASALLIMTSVQGRGYFQHANSHKHNYTNPAF